MAFKPQEVAQITVNGMNYRDWESVTVHLAEGESNNSFRFTCSEGKPLSKNWAEIRIKPGDHCTVKLAGELAISGYVETRQVAYSAEQHGIEIIGVSYNKALADGSAMTETGEFRKKNFQQIATKVCQPHGIKFIPKTPISNKPFERACIPPGETGWNFLETLARMRGITLGTDVQGNMTGRMFYTGGGDSLIEGVNILEGREVMSSSQGDGPNNVIGQEGGSNVNFGPAVAHGPNASSQGRNNFGKGVHAPNVNVAEHPTDKKDAQTRADGESKQRGSEKLQVTIVVQGWLKPSGGLWKPGAKAHVKSPMLILDEPLNIKSVTFTQDSKSGTRTTLELTNDEGAGSENDAKGPDFSQKSDTGGPNFDASTAPRSPSLGE